MDLFYEMQGVFIGLLGWGATTLLLNNASKISQLEQRFMTVCAWTIWMIIGMGTLVHKGLITSNTAITFCGLSTIVLALLVTLSAMRWSRRV
jgi:hypothetical protein